MGMKKEISHELPQSAAGYPAIMHPVIYPTLGLANESGKVAGKVKKIFRDKGGVIGDAEREARTWSLPVGGGCSLCAHRRPSEVG
jgi:hypothetical protein